jgi:hypothetical protein
MSSDRPTSRAAALLGVSPATLRTLTDVGFASSSHRSARQPVDPGWASCGTGPPAPRVRGSPRSTLRLRTARGGPGRCPRDPRRRAPARGARPARRTGGGGPFRAAWRLGLPRSACAGARAAEAARSPARGPRARSDRSSSRRSRSVGSLQAVEGHTIRGVPRRNPGRQEGDHEPQQGGGVAVGSGDHVAPGLRGRGGRGGYRRRDAPGDRPGGPAPSGPKNPARGSSTWKRVSSGFDRVERHRRPAAKSP